MVVDTGGLPQYEISAMKRSRNTIQQQYRKSLLGNQAGRIDVPGQDGFVYVRYYGGVDENGNALYQQATSIRSGVGKGYIAQAGANVVVGKDEDGFNSIQSGGWMQTLQAGINPAVQNPLRKEASFFTNDSYIPLLSFPTGTGTNPSTLVTVREWIYVDDAGGYHHTQGTPTSTDQIDLASFIPIAGEHCYAVVWLDTYTEGYEVTVSTAQTMFTPLDATDLAEAFEERPADGVPIKAYYLANAQAAIVQVAKHLDLRQMLNVPKILGFPQTLTTKERVHAGYTFLVPPFATSGAGDLDLDTGARITLVPHTNLSATTNPTVTDDSGDGYSVGSLWVNVTLDKVWFCVDASVGAAIWVDVSAASSGVTSVTGTAPIASSGGATPAISLNNTAVTPASYTNTNLTVDAQGRITAASNGSGGSMTSFDVSGDSGTPQPITNGNTLNISGGLMLDSVASATDVLTVKMSTDAGQAQHLFTRDASGVPIDTANPVILGDLTIDDTLTSNTDLMVYPAGSTFQVLGASGWVGVNKTTAPTAEVAFEVAGNPSIAIPLASSVDTITTPSEAMSVFFMPTHEPMFYTGVGAGWSRFRQTMLNRNNFEIRASNISILGNMTAVPTVTGAVLNGNSADGTFLNIEAAAGAGNSAGIVSLSFNLLRAAHFPYYEWVFSLPSVTDIRIWVGITSAAFNNADALTGTTQMAGFRYSSTTDTGWTPVTHSATTQTTGTSLGTIGTGMQRLSAFRDGNIWYFGWNGSDLQSINSNMPATTTNLGYALTWWNKAVTAKFLDFSRAGFYYT